MTKKTSIVETILSQVVKKQKEEKQQDTENQPKHELADRILNAPDDYWLLRRNYNSRRRGNEIASAKKREIHQIIDSILAEADLPRPLRCTNPVFQHKQTAKTKYKEITGKDFPRSDRTLENWIYDFYNNKK